MTEEKLIAAGLVKCDACNRWMYRDEGTPCPFCAVADATCVTCGGPADDTGHTFVTEDGTVRDVCGECCQIITAARSGAEDAR